LVTCSATFAQVNTATPSYKQGTFQNAHNTMKGGKHKHKHHGKKHGDKKMSHSKK